MPFVKVESNITRGALAEMRDRSLPSPHFRACSDALLGEEASLVYPRLDLKKDQDTVLVFIYRAALAGLAAGMGTTHFSGAPIGFVGLERQEDKCATAHMYYNKVPINPGAQYLVFDPMFATGGSMTRVLAYLISRGIPVGHLASMMVVAAPEAFRRLEQEPWGKDIPVFGVALDGGLDQNNFIRDEGLGDYGDRYFGTNGGSGLILPA